MDGTLVSDDCQQLRPGIGLLFSVLLTLRFELHGWSAAGKDHAEAMVRKFRLPIIECHLKSRDTRLVLYELPADTTVVLTIDDQADGRIVGIPLLLLDHFVGDVPVVV